MEIDTDLASAAAFSKARAKLKHTAFIELNREAVVKVCDGDAKHYWGVVFEVLSVQSDDFRFLPR